MIKLDSSGKIQWDKTIGGDNIDLLNDLVQTLDGGFILGGYSLSGKSGEKSQESKGSGDYWIVKLDAEGNIQWDKSYGGDGKTQASMLDCEATLAAERFDPLLRDGFTAFFAKALNRNPLKRFDNAEEMLRDWRRIFEAGASASQQSADPFEAVARLATASTNMAELGYSVEAQNVLEAMSIQEMKSN